MTVSRGEAIGVKASSDELRVSTEGKRVSKLISPSVSVEVDAWRDVLLDTIASGLETRGIGLDVVDEEGLAVNESENPDLAVPDRAGATLPKR